MKIVFNRSLITEAVSPLMSAVSSKSTQVAVEGILIEAKMPDTCTLTTYDLEKGMIRTVEAKVIEEGSYIINAQKFLQTMRVMDGEEVTLEVEENLTATIKCGKSSHKMSALRGTDFPEIPNLKTEKGFVVDQKILKKMLAKVTYAMGVNDQRPVLNGCYFKVLPDSLLLVSCDSYKMAKCSTVAKIENKNEDNSDINFSFIIPTKTVNELFKQLADDEKSTVCIYTSRKNIIFRLGDITFFSRLIDGEYIDYERIIVKNHRIKVTMSREELLSALERAALITEERITGSVRSSVKLEFEDGVLKVSATSSVGSTYDEVMVHQEGENISISFNNRFLMDSVRACSSEDILISLSSPLSSINIEAIGGKEEEKEMFMILPVRTK